ncbi:MAG: hypothetical protein KI793_27040 [Rivularia sp. (in: Bacteria)]|nr:hypothetical protein [Rivularia sp. MS3]
MSEIEAIDQLKNAGLFVEPVGEIGPFANGYFIAKLKETPGNTREDCESFIDIKVGDTVKEIPSDAPISHLFPKNYKWIFRIWEYMPGPGPGDFEEEFALIDDAIPVILDYYFGNPSKMNPPELSEEE